MAVPPVSGNNPTGGIGKSSSASEPVSEKKAEERRSSQRDPVDIRTVSAEVSRALKGDFETTLSAQKPDEIVALTRETSALLSSAPLTLGLDTSRTY